MSLLYIRACDRGWGGTSWQPLLGQEGEGFGGFVVRGGWDSSKVNASHVIGGAAFVLCSPDII